MAVETETKTGKEKKKLTLNAPCGLLINGCLCGSEHRNQLEAISGNFWDQC